jgi:hypothetical protein
MFLRNVGVYLQVHKALQLRRHINRRNANLLPEELMRDSIILPHTSYLDHVRFQVLTAANMKMRAFWGIAPCSLVVVDRCIRGAYCLHQHRQFAHSKRRSTTTRLHGAISQKALIFIPWPLSTKFLLCARREDNEIMISSKKLWK